MAIKDIFSRKPSLEKLIEKGDIDGLLEYIKNPKKIATHPAAFSALADLCNSGQFIVGDDVSDEARKIIKGLIDRLAYGPPLGKEFARDILLGFIQTPMKIAVVDEISNRLMCEELFYILTEYLLDEAIRAKVFQAIHDIGPLSWKAVYVKELISKMNGKDEITDDILRVLCDTLIIEAPIGLRHDVTPTLVKSLQSFLTGAPRDMKFSIIELCSQKSYTIGQAMDPANMLLSNLFHDGDNDVRCAAIMAYGTQNEERAIYDGVPLIELSDDPDKDVRALAVSRLKERQFDGVVEVLISHITKKDELSALATDILLNTWILKELTGERSDIQRKLTTASIKMIVRSISQWPQETKLSIATALGEHIEEYPRTYIISVLNALIYDSDKETRIAAIQSYGKVFENNVMFDGKKLIELLHLSSDLDIRLAAIEQLSKSASKYAIDTLGQLAKEKDAILSKAAKSAIETIKVIRKTVDPITNVSPEEYEAQLAKRWKDRSKIKSQPTALDDKYEEMRKGYESDGSGQSPYNNKI